MTDADKLRAIMALLEVEMANANLDRDQTEGKHNAMKYVGKLEGTVQISFRIHNIIEAV